jgi:hypothetical protein
MDRAMSRECAQEATCHPLIAHCWFSVPAGAVASSVVKQKLAEVILKKQQAAALERTVHPSSPSIPYRLLSVPTVPWVPTVPLLFTLLTCECMHTGLLSFPAPISRTLTFV